MPSHFDQLKVHRFGTDDCTPTVYLSMDAQEGAVLAERLNGLHWNYVLISGLDWNRDLTPWPASAAMRGGKDFAGGAVEYMKWLEDYIRREGDAGFCPSARFIAGYSLAGLFAAWAAVSSECFDGFASVSGSLWYPGFADYIEKRTTVPDYAYFSMGEREAHGKNPAFQGLESTSRRLHRYFELSGARTCLEFNPGGHFQDPTGRMERAVRWLWRQWSRARQDGGLS